MKPANTIEEIKKNLEESNKEFEEIKNNPISLCKYLVIDYVGGIKK